MKLSCTQIDDKVTDKEMSVELVARCCQLLWLTDNSSRDGCYHERRAGRHGRHSRHSRVPLAALNARPQRPHNVTTAHPPISFCPIFSFFLYFQTAASPRQSCPSIWGDCESIHDILSVMFLFDGVILVHAGGKSELPVSHLSSHH